MKIRTCFVSNSSSSSFCLLGVVVDYSEYPELETGSSSLVTSWTGLDNYSSDELIVGAYPYKMKNKETLLEFKERVLKELELIGLKDVKISDLNWHIDGGWDG